MEQKTPLQRFYGLLKNYRKQLWQIYAYAFFIGLVNLSLPLGIQSIINYIQIGEISTSWVVLVGIVLFGIAVAGLLQVLQLRIVEDIQHDIFSRSALEFAYRIPKLDLLKLDEVHLPEIANRFFDTLTVQKGIPKILMDFSLASFQIVLGLILLTFYSPYFILLGVVLFLVTWVILYFTGRKGLDYSLQESKYKYKIAHWLEDISSNNKSFKFYSDKQFHLHKADELIVRYLDAREKHFKTLMFQFKQFVGLKIFLAASLLIAGGLMVMNERLNIGQFVAAEILIILIINSLEKVIKVFETIYDVLTGLEKIGQVTDIELDNPLGTYSPHLEQGFSVHLENVSFQFPNTKNPLVQNLTCDVTSGTTALLDGKGKTTVLKLLSGMYTMQNGELLLNNIPITNYNQKFLHEEIGIYFSTNELFDGTIWENLTLGYPAEEKEVYDILNHLNVMNFVGRQTDGIYNKIDTAGRRLPKSVIQKLSLARAILHQPKLLLLDEPLTAVELEERNQIFEWLNSSEHCWSIVVASNDLFWKQNADQIINV